MTTATATTARLKPDTTYDHAYHDDDRDGYDGYDGPAKAGHYVLPPYEFSTTRAGDYRADVGVAAAGGAPRNTLKPR